MNVSKATATGDYASVNEQSGIKAGDGGFQLDVQGITDLKGGVIASTSTAVQNGVNKLVTAALVQSDIQNTNTYQASGYSVGVTISGTLGDQPALNKQEMQDIIAFLRTLNDGYASSGH